MNRSNYHNDGKRERCYFCPEDRNLDEHHIVPQRFGGSDSAVNVVTVCERCHDKLERLYDKRFYQHFNIEDEKGERLYHIQCRWHDCDNYATHVAPIADGVYRCDQHPQGERKLNATHRE